MVECEDGGWKRKGGKGGREVVGEGNERKCCEEIEIK